MATTYNTKTAARLLAAATGHTYQQALHSVTTGNLDPLLDEPHTGPADTMLNLLGVQLVAAGTHPTLHDARGALLLATLGALLREWNPDVVAATVAFDEEAPFVGYLDAARLADGTELDELHGDTISDDVFAWAHLLCCHLDLGPGEGQEVLLTP